MNYLFLPPKMYDKMNEHIKIVGYYKDDHGVKDPNEADRFSVQKKTFEGNKALVGYCHTKELIPDDKVAVDYITFEMKHYNSIRSLQVLLMTL